MQKPPEELEEEHQLEMSKNYAQFHAENGNALRFHQLVFENSNSGLENLLFSPPTDDHPGGKLI